MIDTSKYEGHTPTEEWGDIVFAHGYLPIFLDDDVDATDIDRRLMADAPRILDAYDDLKKRADFMEWQLAKTAGALAYEWREPFDELGDKEFYLWLIETFGTDEDKEYAGIEGEEE